MTAHPAVPDGSSNVELPPTARALLDAVVAISSDLDFRSVLGRIVGSACELTEARYGALGVIGADGNLAEFITTGLPHGRALIGDPPRGHGILGLLIQDPRPLRLDDLRSHPAAVGFPVSHPEMHTFLGVPIRVRGTVFGNLYLTQKAGVESFTALDETLVEALASAAGYVIENARAFGISERRRRWLEATAELTDELQPPIERVEAMRLIADFALRVSGARGVGLVSDVHSGEPTVSHAAGVPRQQAASVLELFRARVPDHQLEAEPVLLDGPGDLGDLVAVLVPVKAHLGGLDAMVVLFDRGAMGYDFDDREMLAAFAEAAGLALDRTQAVADREELAVVLERERIARDLHDLVIQRLFATGMSLQGLPSKASADEVSSRIDKAVDDLDLTVKDIRATIFALQGRGNGSFRTAVRRLVKEYVPALGVTPSVRTLGPVDTAVPDAIRNQVLTVLREAISNVARHALAEHVEVELQARADSVVVTVTDDGVGVPATRRDSGLQNLRRRAEALGGSLELEGREPHGTVFTWQAPLSQDDEGD